MARTQHWIFQDEGYPTLIILENGYYYRYLITVQNFYFMGVQNEWEGEFEAYRPSLEILAIVEFILISETETRYYEAIEIGLKAS